MKIIKLIPFIISNEVHVYLETIIYRSSKKENLRDTNYTVFYNGKHRGYLERKKIGIRIDHFKFMFEDFFNMKTHELEDNVISSLKTRLFWGVDIGFWDAGKITVSKAIED